MYFDDVISYIKSSWSASTRRSRPSAAAAKCDVKPDGTVITTITTTTTATTTTIIVSPTTN